MTKEQSTFMPKDNYFRTPIEDLTKPEVEVETGSVNRDDVKYKDKYFQVPGETEGS